MRAGPGTRPPSAQRTADTETSPLYARFSDTLPCHDEKCKPRRIFRSLEGDPGLKWMLGGIVVESAIGAWNRHEPAVERRWFRLRTDNCRTAVPGDRPSDPSIGGRTRQLSGDAARLSGQDTSTALPPCPHSLAMARLTRGSPVAAVVLVLSHPFGDGPARRLAHLVGVGRLHHGHRFEGPPGRAPEKMPIHH